MSSRCGAFASRASCVGFGSGWDGGRATARGGAEPPLAVEGGRLRRPPTSGRFRTGG
ncbi:hypothetical protein F750_0386 [Streptomyces sp. PAMC 26508]|nr:hypothetical protein F750_0386 [Streptomyces sp. PAMC 26508]